MLGLLPGIFKEVVVNMKIFESSPAYFSYFLIFSPKYNISANSHSLLLLLTMLINEHDFALTCSTITIRYNIFHAPHFVCDIF